MAFRMMVLAILFLFTHGEVMAFDIEAHRGGRALRPENTLVSFANALSMGVDTLELDIGVTADGASSSPTSAASIPTSRAMPRATMSPRPAFPLSACRLPR